MDVKYFLGKHGLNDENVERAIETCSVALEQAGYTEAEIYKKLDGAWERWNKYSISAFNITADILTPYFETTKELLAEEGVVATYDPDTAKLFVDGEEYYPEKPHEKRVIEWLHKQIENSTHGTMQGNICAYYYDEMLSSAMLENAIHDYISDYKYRDYEKFSYYLENIIDVTLSDITYQIEITLFNCIQDILPKDDEMFMRTWKRLTKNLTIYAVLDLGGWNGIDVDYKSYLDRDYFLNIMLATSEEQNMDMNSISDFFIQREQSEETLKKESDNALTYLIHQQGYTVKDITKAYSNKETASEFVKSTKQELDSLEHSSSELTMCVSLKGQALIDTLDALLDKDNIQNLKVSPKTTVGLFNEWNGSCSNLDIKLEKDFIFPNNMVRNIQVDKSSHRDFSNAHKYGYTVQNVCDPAAAVWKNGKISVTDEQPVLVNETLEEMQKAFVPVQDSPDSDDFFNR